MTGPQTFPTVELDVKKRCSQKLFGTHAATAPAMSRPMAMSRMTAAHSMTKMCDTDVAPAGDMSRFRKLASPGIDMSMAACPSIDPDRPLSAWARASSSRRLRRNKRKANATRTIMIGPPTNSARVNCQPSSRAMMIPSSMTRLVDAISNAIAAPKLAPLRKRDLASATAA
jgi:hypothetical protein